MSPVYSTVSRAAVLYVCTVLHDLTGRLHWPLRTALRLQRSALDFKDDVGVLLWVFDCHSDLASDSDCCARRALSQATRTQHKRSLHVRVTQDPHVPTVNALRLAVAPTATPRPGRSAAPLNAVGCGMRVDCHHRDSFHAPPTRKRPRRPAARSRRARRPTARRRPVLVIVAAVIVVVVAVVIVVALVVLRLSGRGFRRALPLLEAARL